MATTVDGFKEITLTTDEIKALRAAPKTLISAPGSGKLLILKGAHVLYKFVTTGYTINAGGDDMQIRYVDGSGQLASDVIETTGLIDQPADTVHYVNALSGSSTIKASANILNRPLVLNNIGAAEYTLGDGTLIINVYYSIIDFN